VGLQVETTKHSQSFRVSFHLCHGGQSLGVLSFCVDSELLGWLGEFELLGSDEVSELNDVDDSRLLGWLWEMELLSTDEMSELDDGKDSKLLGALSSQLMNSNLDIKITK